MSFCVPKTFTWLAFSLLLMTSGGVFALPLSAQQEAKPARDTESTPPADNVKSEGKEAFAGSPVKKDKRESSATQKAGSKESNKSPKLAKSKEAGDRVDARKYYHTLIDAYFDGVFKLEPHYATELGVHDYDGLMPDMSPDGVKKETRFDKDYLKKFEAVDAASLSEKDRLDLALVVNQIKDKLLEVEEIASYKRNPSNYSELACAAVFALMKRTFAEPADRLKSVIAREKAIPEMLKIGRQNIKVESVPKVFAEIDLEQLPGII